MNNRESISSLIEDCHLGRKPKVSFQGELKRLKKLNFLSLDGSFDENCSKMSNKSYFKPHTVRRSSHFYIKAYKIPHKILNNTCETTTIVCDTTAINVFYGNHSFIDATNREPDLIIPYEIIKSIQFFSNYDKMVQNSKQCLSPLMMNISSNDSRVVAYSLTATESRDYEDARLLTFEDKFLSPNKIETCKIPKNEPTNCLFGPLCIFRNIFTKSKFLGNQKQASSGPSSPVMEKTKRCSVPILSRESVSDIYSRKAGVLDDYSKSSISYTSDDECETKEKTYPSVFYPPDLDDKAGRTYIFMKINIHKTLAYTKLIKNLLQYETLNFYLPQCRAILLKRHIELYFCRPAIKFRAKTVNSVYSFEKSEEQCSSDSEMFVPMIDKRSCILTEELYISAYEYLPCVARAQQLELIYSTEVHGSCLKTLYRNCAEYQDRISMIMFKEETGNIFGAFLTSAPSESKTYYGIGDCCVFRYDPTCQNIQVYKWAFRNNYFMIGDPTGFSVGGGGPGASIWISEDLIHGRSCSSVTFLNEQLSDCEDFTCLVVEVWIFK